MTLQDLKNLETTTALEQEIKEIILNNVDCYDNPEDFFTDLQQNGCISGMVSELIYYEDTTDFCNRNANDINEVIQDLLNMYDLKSIRELVGDKFDVVDTLMYG